MKDDKNVVSGNVTRNDAPHVTGGVNTRLVILLTLSPYTYVTAPIICRRS